MLMTLSVGCLCRSAREMPRRSSSCPSPSRRSATLPLATSLPWCSTTTSSPSSTSSIRCVAQKTLMPSVVDQSADVGQDAGARLHVQPDGRLVQQQQRRPVQQRAGDLDAPHLAAGEAAGLVVQAAAHLDRFQQRAMRALRLAVADAVQGGVIGQVLVDAQIEHRACAPERRCRAAATPRPARGGYRGRRCGSRPAGCRRDG